MAKKSIIWSQRANLELRNVLEFYSTRNGNTSYSLKILNEVNKLLIILANNEFIGRLTANKTTRVITLGVYLVFYEVNNKQIEILSFWDNRQDPNKKISQ